MHLCVLPARCFFLSSTFAGVLNAMHDVECLRETILYSNFKLYAILVECMVKNFEIFNHNDVCDMWCVCIKYYIAHRRKINKVKMENLLRWDKQCDGKWRTIILQTKWMQLCVECMNKLLNKQTYFFFCIHSVNMNDLQFFFFGRY